MGWPNCRFVLKALVSRIRHGGVMDDASPIVVNGKAHLSGLCTPTTTCSYTFFTGVNGVRRTQTKYNVDKNKRELRQSTRKHVNVN